MLKIFLAEDEFVVREGIKNNIDWSAHGYNFCGEAGDGEMAYSMIQKLQPDIVITDIKMPFMDGLALSRMIKDKFPHIEIILLTGYEDFEFAKEAIRIGVSSYLSKPISGDNLIKEVDAVADKIREKNLEREAAKRYREDMREREELDKKELFEDIVTGGRDLPYILDKAKRLDVDISALCYNVMILKVWSKKHEADEFSGSVVKVISKIEEMVTDRGALMFNVNIEGKGILLKADSDSLMESLTEELIASMKELFSSYPNIRFFGGVGQIVSRITDIPRSFEWASRAYAHLYLTSDSRFLYGTSEGLKSPQDQVILSEIDPRHIDRKLVKEFLRRGDVSEAEYFLEEFFAGMGEGAMRSTMMRQYISMDMYFCVTDFAENELGLSRSDVTAAVPAAELLSDEDTTREYLYTIVKQAIELRNDNSLSHYSEIVRQVTDYVEENFADEDLSLNTLAAVVNFSPNHLSAVFRQQTGQTLIKYLTDFRMDKAKELLSTTSKKSNEIAPLVGYKDPHYFSYLFKKTQGMTTTQYRGGRQKEEEG